MVDHRRIRELTGAREEQNDVSLRGNALRRALGDKPPKTLTPFEWEQWYAEHGVPEEHLQMDGNTPDVAWWRRLKGFLGGIRR